MSEMKVLIISFIFPPCVVGAGTVMYNLCKYLPTRDYFVITTKEQYCMRWGTYDKDYKLKCRSVRLPVCLHGTLNLFVFSLFATIRGLQIMKKEKINSILAVHPFFYNLLTAYILHKLTKRPFVIYMHDLFSEVKRRALMYGIWSFLERKIFSNATRILVMNEEYKKYYCQREICNTIIFPPSIDLEQYINRETTFLETPCNKEPLKVAYTGSVYAAQESSVVAFLEAVRKMDDVNVFFAIPVIRGYLRDYLKNYHKRSNIGFLPKKECIALQKNADILLLPLSSNSPYPEEIKCAFPCKLLEYLAAGKPILALVPKGSFVESFIKKYDVGLAVNESSINEIIDAVNKLKDKTRRAKFSQNALQTARLFDAKIWTKELCVLLDNLAEKKVYQPSSQNVESISRSSCKQ
jgi:glycosyltransferase involved in cell wall biosynthesis